MREERGRGWGDQVHVGHRACRRPSWCFVSGRRCKHVMGIKESASVPRPSRAVCVCVRACVRACMCVLAYLKHRTMDAEYAWPGICVWACVHECVHARAHVSYLGRQSALVHMRTKSLCSALCAPQHDGTRAHLAAPKGRGAQARTRAYRTNLRGH